MTLSSDRIHVVSVPARYDKNFCPAIDDLFVIVDGASVRPMYFAGIEQYEPGRYRMVAKRVPMRFSRN